MKALGPLRLAASVLAVVVSIGVASVDVHAQSSDAAPTAKSGKAANRALSKDVRRALTKTKGLTSSNINVRVRGGAVTLAGTVPDNAQIDMATEAAKGVAGVTSVKNAITVRAIGQ